jgi:hypothetical protein
VYEVWVHDGCEWVWVMNYIDGRDANRHWEDECGAVCLVLDGRVILEKGVEDMEPGTKGKWGARPSGF